MSKVSIINYGIGNILSVERAFKKVGADVEYVTQREEIEKAEHLVLPGVGAFRNGMAELEKRNLVQAIRCYCEEDRPFLGICLGMQMMLDESEEFGLSEGLGIIPGRVVRIPDTDQYKNSLKVPHVGWNILSCTDNMKVWNNTILSGISSDSQFYFVHSYMACPPEEYRFADTYYGGNRISAVIRKGNCYGTQFHPEKSGEVGLSIIDKFAKL